MSPVTPNKRQTNKNIFMRLYCFLTIGAASSICSSVNNVNSFLTLKNKKIAQNPENIEIMLATIPIDFQGII